MTWEQRTHWDRMCRLALVRELVRSGLCEIPRFACAYHVRAHCWPCWLSHAEGAPVQFRRALVP